MLDIETLSLRTDAAVVAIGASVFDESQIIESRHWPLTFDGLTGHIEPKTVLWWMQQSKEAQQATFGESVQRVRPFFAAHDLADLVDQHKCRTIWANDPHFDVVVMQNWWRRYSTPSWPQGRELIEPAIVRDWPFEYNQPRSYRTIVELARAHGFSDQQYDSAKGMHVAHCAVDDAAAQARVVLACEQWLARGQYVVQAPSATWRNGNLPV